MNEEICVANPGFIFGVHPASSVPFALRCLAEVACKVSVFRGRARIFPDDPKKIHRETALIRAGC